MALPVTISNVDVGPQNSYHGPFKSSGGAFYTILLDSTSNNLVEAHKATDPTVSFTEQDGTNRPNFVNNVLSLNVFQDGDLLKYPTLRAISCRGNILWFETISNLA